MGEKQGGESTSADTLLDSTLDSVDAAEAIVLDAAGRFGLDEENLHKLGMAVRESMVNAVVHGNRYSAHKKVHLKVLNNSERLTVRITDQGAGFDIRSLPDPLAPENLLKQSGRGILLIQAFVDEFDVRRAEPAGTEVTLVKYRSQRG
jgi:serine/threonine-protein kinase RsbW